jgi:NADH-quinone oxidoreductase subunit N
MQIETLLLLRHEILLTILVLVALFFEVFVDKKDKNRFIPILIVLFFITTIVGFLPQNEGTIFGGMFISGKMQILMKNVLNIGVLIILLQSVQWLKKDENKHSVLEFVVLLLSTLIGMNFMISSGDFLMFYIGLELATIPIAALAAFERYKVKSAEAGIKLILSSALSSGILLFGVSILYMISGSIYFEEVALKMQEATPLTALGLVFFFAGMGFKISLVPFHLWTADVYEGAPVNVTSYLSVISKGAAAFILTIILFKVFGQLADLWQGIGYVLAVLTMTIGNLFAIRQNNLKRFLAFSSIAQAGFILLGVINAGSLGMTTIIYFALIYIFSNLAAFGVVGAVLNFSGKENISDYNGFYRTNPRLSLIMMLALFSLAGIPPVAGFFGKFFLFTAAAQQGYYWLVFIAIANATISLYYYLLVVKAMFINKNETPIAKFKSDGYTKAGLLISVIGIFAIGFIGALYEYIKTVVDSF